MIVSVVIPAFNAEKTIERQLRGLEDQRFEGEYEIIVVDNRSTDRTREIVQSMMLNFPQLVLIEETSRQGANAARNAGLRASKGELILFCDADDLVSGHWIAALTESLRAYDLVGGSAIAVIESGGELVYLDSDSIDSPPNVHGYFPYAISCNMGIRREVAQEIGGFDESFVGGHEEVDFCWRAQQHGYRLTWNHHASVLYYQREDPKGTFRQRSRYAATSIQLWERHKDTGELKPISFAGSVRNLARMATRFPQLLRREMRRDFLLRQGWVWGVFLGHLKYRKLGKLPDPIIPSIS